MWPPDKTILKPHCSVNNILYGPDWAWPVPYEKCARWWSLNVNNRKGVFEFLMNLIGLRKSHRYKYLSVANFSHRNCLFSWKYLWYESKHLVLITSFVAKVSKLVTGQQSRDIKFLPIHIHTQSLAGFSRRGPSRYNWGGGLYDLSCRRPPGAITTFLLHFWRALSLSF